MKALGLQLHVGTYNKGMLAYARVDMCNKVEELAEVSHTNIMKRRNAALICGKF